MEDSIHGYDLQFDAETAILNFQDLPFRWTAVMLCYFAFLASDLLISMD